MVNFLTSILRQYPNLLADFDFRIPVTAFDFSSEFATDEWLLQETSGSYSNNKGSETLSSTGSFALQGQTAVGVFNGTDYTSRKAWEASKNATSSKLASSGTTAGDSDDVDFAARVVVRQLVAPVATAYCLTKRQAGGTGWAILQIANGTWRFLVRDGTTTYTQDLSIPTFGGVTIISAWYDKSSQIMYIKSNYANEASKSTGTSSTFTNSQGIGINNYPANIGASKTQVLYAGVCVGANAQNFYDTVPAAPGEDPSGLLTTISRDSLISVPVGTSSVAHFQGGTTLTTCQLPIGFHSSLNGGAGGLGLYCNSAVTNLIPESEDLGTTWLTANTTLAVNQGDSPDGFRSAGTATATANDGEGRIDSAGTAAEYTLSAWVKRNGGSDVSGSVRLVDLTNAADIADTAFTATSVWQRVSTTGTMQGGCTDIRNKFRINTSGDSIFLWGAQIELGDGAGAYIRTSGATASLISCDYETISADGLYMKAATGEAEVVFITNGNSDGASAYLFDATDGGGNDNRRWLSLGTNHDIPNFGGYSSSSELEFNMSDGVKATSSAEATVVCRWDASGGLAAGGGEDATQTFNGDAGTSDVGSFTATETIDRLQIGAFHTVNSINALNGWIARIRIWDSERS